MVHDIFVKVKFKVDAYMLNLGGLDLILGMEWLEALHETKTNWKKKIMCFN